MRVKLTPICSKGAIVAFVIAVFSVGYNIQLALAFPNSNSAFTSVEDYDMQKNCTADLDKKPTSIEYLTHFNCGRVSQGETGQTIREFTLIIEENQNITISNAGHYFDAWTFNGTVPGPTMRMTEGDLVRINVINSNDNQHTHSLHMHSIHTAEMDGVATPASSNSHGNKMISTGDVFYESGHDFTWQEFYI
jgi:Multicopper oxidase